MVYGLSDIVRYRCSLSRCAPAPNGRQVGKSRLEAVGDVPRCASQNRAREASSAEVRFRGRGRQGAAAGAAALSASTNVRVPFCKMGYAEARTVVSIIYSKGSEKKGEEGPAQVRACEEGAGMRQRRGRRQNENCMAATAAQDGRDASSAEIAVRSTSATVLALDVAARRTRAAASSLRL